MTTFIIHHPIVSLLIVAFVAALIALFVGGLCKSAATEPASMIEPDDLIERCAWCDHEQAVKSQPNYSHGICKRHFDKMLSDAKRLSRS
jgi:hypothetical protein